MKLGTGVRIAPFGGLGAAACAWAPSAMADAHQSNLGSPARRPSDRPSPAAPVPNRIAVTVNLLRMEFGFGPPTRVRS
jgi:hypothetical protein